jgi:transcriptional regulator with XRE-family HTH domain
MLDIPTEDMRMPKMKRPNGASFGARLAELRQQAGYTQVELAEEIGISQRMIAYYEGQTEHPPTTLLPEIARVLGVTADALLGVEAVTKRAKPKDSRLQRRLQQIEKLGAREKRQILQLLDTFLENQKLNQRRGNGAERTT